MHAAKTVILAFGGIIAILLIVTNIHLAIITFAAVVTVPVIVGQLIRMQPFFLAIVPPAHQSLVPELLPCLVPQPYSQAVLFRAEARGLPWLLIPPLYSMSLAVIVVSGVWQHWSWNPSDSPFSPSGTSGFWRLALRHRGPGCGWRSGYCSAKAPSRWVSWKTLAEKLIWGTGSSMREESAAVELRLTSAGTGSPAV